MESKPPAPSKGYQKQIKPDEKPSSPPKPKIAASTDYSSPLAKKWPQFVQAIQNGNADVVQQLVEEGMNVNLLRDGATPLMLAASKGQVETAGVLLQAGANVNAKSDDGCTALHAAAGDQAETAIIEFLLQSGIECDAKNKAGKTALQVAEEKGHREVGRIIKQHQAKLRHDAQEWEEFLRTPEGKPWKQQKRDESLGSVVRFWWAPAVLLGIIGVALGSLLSKVLLCSIIGLASGLLIGGSVFLLKWNTRRYLDALGPLPEMNIHILREKRKAGVPLMTVWKKEETPAEEEIVEIPAPVQETQLTPIDAPPPQKVAPAVTKRKKLSWKIMLSAVLVLLFMFFIGAVVGSRDALLRWHYAKKLATRGAPFSEQAFLAEVSKNNEEVVALYAKAGINVKARNEQGKSALVIASENGSVPMVKKLAQLNAALLNDADGNGNTALITAARRGNEAIVKALIESGADVNFTVPSNEGPATALQAVLNADDFTEDHQRIMQYLLQQGANAKGKNAAGQSPLLFAAERGRTDAAKVLLSYGADVNDADRNGRFPLYAAACKGYSWFVVLLADKGADVDRALPDGQTALMCAAREGYGDTVRTLLERGARITAKTPEGATALSEATRMGNIAVVTLLLSQGADPVSGYLPAAYVGLQGRPVIIKAKNNPVSALLKKIAKSASQDGYTLHDAPQGAQKLTITTKGPWNKVLNDLATKSNLLLVVKGQEIFFLSYDPAGIKRENK